MTPVLSNFFIRHPDAENVSTYIFCLINAKVNSTVIKYTEKKPKKLSKAYE